MSKVITATNEDNGVLNYFSVASFNFRLLSVNSVLADN